MHFDKVFVKLNRSIIHNAYFSVLLVLTNCFQSLFAAVLKPSPNFSTNLSSFMELTVAILVSELKGEQRFIVSLVILVMCACCLDISKHSSCEWQMTLVRHFSLFQYACRFRTLQMLAPIQDIKLYVFLCLYFSNGCECPNLPKLSLQSPSD